MNEFMEYYSHVIALCLIVAFMYAYALIGIVQDKRQKAKCKHEQCEKLGESTTYDMQLNPTSTVKLKCLECEKIFEVKK